MMDGVGNFDPDVLYVAAMSGSTQVGKDENNIFIFTDGKTKVKGDHPALKNLPDHYFVPADSEAAQSGVRFVERPENDGDTETTAGHKRTKE